MKFSVTFRLSAVLSDSLFTCQHLKPSRNRITHTFACNVRFILGGFIMCLYSDEISLEDVFASCTLCLYDTSSAPCPLLSGEIRYLISMEGKLHCYTSLNVGTSPNFLDVHRVVYILEKPLMSFVTKKFNFI